MKEKMIIAASKLKKTVIAASIASVHCKAYPLATAYFGHRVMKLILLEEEILKKIYEPILL